MSLLPMHPVLSNALRHYFNGEKHTRVFAPQLPDLEDLVVNILAQNLLDNKTTLIVCPDEADPAWMAKIMSVYGLSQYCLVWTNDYLSQQKPVKRIRSFRLKEQKQFDQDQYRVALNIQDDMVSILKEYVYHLHKPILGTYTWKDILSMQCKIKSVSNNVHAFEVPEQWHEKDHNDFLHQIARAEQDFENKFALLSEINLLNPNLYREEVTSEMLVDELTVMLEDIREIKNLYEHHLEVIKTELINNIESEYLKIAELHLKLDKYCARLKMRSQKKIVDQPLVAGLSTGREFRMIEEIIIDLNKELFNADFYDVSISDSKTTGWSMLELESYIKSIDTALNAPGHSVEKKLKAQLRRMGPFNVEDDRIQSLEDRLDQFIQQLNDSYILKDSIHNNSLNFEKKILLIKSIEDDLCRSIIFLEAFPEYHEWRRSLTSEELEEAVLHDLALGTDSWKPRMRKSMIDQVLTKNYHPFISGIRDQVYQYQEQTKEIYHRTLDKIHWTCYDTQNYHKERLKSKSAFLYQELFKSDEDAEISITEIIISNKEFFDAFCPVVMTTKKYLADLITMTDTGWDVIIGLDSQLTGLDEVHPGQVIELSKLGHGFKANTNHEFAVSAPKLNNVRQLNMTPLMERHKIGHDLARLILDTIDKVSIYQVRNVCMISALGGAIENLVCAPFIPNGIKCLHRDTQDVEALTEAILAIDADIFFLYENGLMDDSKPNDVLWQNQVIDHIKGVGATCISIDSVNVYGGRNKLLKSIRQTILASISKDMDTKPQRHATI